MLSLPSRIPFYLQVRFCATLASSSPRYGVLDVRAIARSAEMGIEESRPDLRLSLMKTLVFETLLLPLANPMDFKSLFLPPA